MAQWYHGKGHPYLIFFPHYIVSPLSSQPFRWICFDFSLLCHYLMTGKSIGSWRQGWGEELTSLTPTLFSLTARNKHIIIPINNNSNPKKKPVTRHFLRYVHQTNCAFIPSWYTCVVIAAFLYLGASVWQDFCFLQFLPLLSKKSSAFPSSSCLKDFFFFLFKTRAYSPSLYVSLIFSFRQNVELLLSTPGYEALVLRSCTGDKGIKASLWLHQTTWWETGQLLQKMLLAINPLFGVVEFISWLFLAANSFLALLAVK